MRQSIRRINEIFYSLQSRGFHMGTPVVFVHFSGCNLRCGSCDTRHEGGVMMTGEEIVEKVSSLPAWMVILTEGGLSLWIGKALISRLREAGKQICIETNGTCPLPDGIDWVACSPKENTPVVLEKVDEIKVVYTGQDLPAYAKIPARYRFLQPCSCQDTEEVVDYILRHPWWRLSL